MNNTTQLLAVLAEYPHMEKSVHKAIQALAFIEREWGCVPPITSIQVVDDMDDNLNHWLELSWTWHGAVSVLWRFTHRPDMSSKDAIRFWTNVDKTIDSKWYPTPKDVAVFLSRYINHIAKCAWDYRTW